MKFLYSLTLLTLSFSLFSQRGKDGTPTITAANTIVNAYTPLTANVISGSTTLNVGSSAAFAVGDLVYIIQMQGVNVNASDNGGNFFGDPNSALPVDTTYGKITSYNNTGMNEFAQINSIPNSTSIVIDCGLKNTYDVTKNYTTASGKNIVLLGNVQVIRVPRYSFLTLSGAATISCPQWNGSTGGIAVVEVENNVVLNSAGAFNVSGRGFRGGAVFNYTPTAIISSDKYGANKSQEGGAKGESIAGDSAMYRNYASVFCRGNMANGGGGGNSHNAGGGGGSNGHSGIPFNSLGNPTTGFNTIWNLEFAGMATNASSGGGRGGYSFSNSNQNVSTVAPGTYSTPSNAWGGDKRRAVGGFGGRPLNYINGRLFLGGGGGAGQGNDNRASAGGNGGGLVYLICYGNVSGSGTILADGANANNTGSGCSSNDGAGGGGGGGAIVLDVNGTINLTAGTALSANGGNGGNVNFNCAFSNATAYGPGAGGGGGYIASTGTLPSNTIVGGNNGTVTGNANNIGNNFPPNGATRGGSGGTGSINAYTLTPSASQTLCTNQAFTVTATSTEPGVSINWYNTLVGGSAIATGTVYASSGYTTAGTYTLFAGACSGTYRQPIIITVNAGLNITVNSPTICPSQTVTLTASGATTYTWVTGAPNSNTLSVSPSSTTIYTVNATSGTCVGSNTTAVVVSAVPTLTVANANICSGNSAILTASGAASYTLSPSTVFTTTISVNPTTTTNYTITGSNGACTNSIAATVSVTATPTITGVANTTICPTQTVSFTAGGANSFTWQPTNFVGATYTISPVSSTTVSVIGSNGTCTSLATASVTIGTGISITVNSPTICAGQTATLTAGGGATSYTWSSGPPNTNTLSVSPTITTTYTILGTNGACSGSNAAVVTVVSVPSVSVTNSAICSGNSAILTASGAASYTLSPSTVFTNSVSVSPNTTTNYTITGSNGTCTNTIATTVSVTATPTITGVANTTICPTQTVSFTAGGANSFTWQPTNFVGATYTIAPVSSTTVSVIGANGTCTSLATATVTVDNTILSTYTLAVSTCPTETVALFGTGTNSATTTYTWSNGVNTFSQTVAPINTTTYVVNGTSLSGCPALSGTVIVNVNSISASFSGLNSTIMSVGETLNLTNTSTGASSILWDYCNGLSTNSVVTVPLADTGSCCIKLVATNATCKDSVIKCVTIITEAVVVIPNVFTPNGDTKNDIFKIASTGLKSLNCIIYDRWGLKMYEWDGVNGYWDGNTKNGNASDGTYFYIINYTDLKDKSVTAKGHLNLFK
jgi:gliding motility-associated-like protein